MLRLHRGFDAQIDDVDDIALFQELGAQLFRKITPYASDIWLYMSGLLGHFSRDGLKIVHQMSGF